MQTHTFDAPARATSAQSLARIGTQGFTQLLDKIHDICVAAALHGARDLSGKEIQQKYELQYGRIEMSTVSSRVNSLVAAGRLVRSAVHRPCCVTGRNIYPVAPAMTQVRLTA